MYHAAPNAHSAFSIHIGANVVVTPRFDPEGLLRLIEQERITHLNMAPIMFKRLLQLPDNVKQRYDLSSQQYVTHAAAPCPLEVKRAAGHQRILRLDRDGERHQSVVGGVAEASRLRRAGDSRRQRSGHHRNRRRRGAGRGGRGHRPDR